MCKLQSFEVAHLGHFSRNHNFYIIQDAAAGDSGAPLYSIGTFNNVTGEKTGETLIGIHSGGFGQSAFVVVLRLAKSGKTALAKWYARVSYFSLF